MITESDTFAQAKFIIIWNLFQFPACRRVEPKTPQMWIEHFLNLSFSNPENITRIKHNIAPVNEIIINSFLLIKEIITI